MEELAKLIMARYYLVSVLGISDLDTSDKEEELAKKALSEFDSISELKEAVNDFIKANDWTGCLGNEGSGERERGLAIEGCIDHADVSKDDDSSNEELFESIFRESQPAGWAVMVNGKIWDTGFEEERARKVAAWLESKDFVESVRVLSPKAQDRPHLVNWTVDEKAAHGL
jgi:hypothetical protein